MIIDCESCTVRGAACADCVVTFLTIPVRPGATGTEPAAPPGLPAGGAATAGPGTAQDLDAREYPPDLDEAERRAIEVLARSGLVPPLRLVRAG